MLSLRVALIGGVVIGTLVVGACGVEVGGLDAVIDSGGPVLPDAGMSDTFTLPDAPMDVQTPDLGTGETESGALCTCTPPLPMNWAFVAWQDKARPNCPMGYNNSSNTVSNLSAPAMTCGCSQQQAPTANPTCTGSTSFTIGFDKSNGCGTITDTINCTACAAVNKTYGADGGDAGDLAYFAANGTPTPTGGTCANPVGTATKPNATFDQGRYCRLNVVPQTCGNGSCVITPGGNDSICIWRTGFNQCPAGFPNTHYVGTNVTDTRSCGPDPCNNTKVTFNKGTCGKPVLGVYSDGNCQSQHFNPQTADNTCVNAGYMGASITVGSCGFTSTNSGAACSYTGTFTPQGGAALTPYQTICCL